MATPQPSDRPAGAPASRRRRRPAARPSRGARRAGYLVAVALDLVLLGLIFRWPGWESLAFLTQDTTVVLPWVAAQIWTGVAVNLVWVAADPRWLRALGDLATSALGLVAALRVLDVFPFAFDEGGFPWATAVRVVLWVGIVGSGIGVLVNLVRLVTDLARQPRAVGHA
ncbi:hypothetical protein Q6348_12315 [Isoptericola sp. b441]|uniref:Uncharacterized protein n=1 Tax=Actinotalea lenta TaxID=3064654 RepID=A0ABT9DBK9_9CELL|nr:MULTISPECIES: hypothetical protein [unclassified Isoptericola]MDO8107980.1 hypothetical protein [Isoptericola sp. b441]MDO8120353.1 hypothetical protein [Isoptericola sp. b490]